MRGRYEAGKRGARRQVGVEARQVKGVRGRYEADKRGARQVRGR